MTKKYPAWLKAAIPALGFALVLWLLLDRSLHAVLLLAVNTAVTGALFAFILTGNSGGREGKLAQKAASLTSLLKEITLKVQLASGQVSAAVEQMSLTTEASRQASASFSAVEEVASSLSNLSDILGQETRENERALNNCRNDMESAGRAIEQIRSQSLEVADHVSGLSGSVGRVDTILESIIKISDQTRLLSLNAAIEAARSGEHGRGFAVVAQEVKKLSEDTFAATNEITDIIGSIRNDVRLVEEKVSGAGSSVAEGVRYTLNARSSLDNIGAAVEAISSTVRKSHGEVGEYLRHVDIAARSQRDNLDKIKELGEIMQKAASIMEEAGKKIQLEGDATKDSSHFREKAGQLMRLLQEMSAGPAIYRMETGGHRHALTQFLKSQADLEAVWTNRMDGTFVFSEPPAGLANARAREWWKQAAAGKEYISEIYVSAITQSPCVTLSAPVRDAAGNIVGVIGADVGI
jgi:methyl-accepting chemotaxis protein